MKKIGLLAEGETPNADQSKDGLRSLNLMISDWNTQGLAVLGKRIDEFSLTPSVNNYTMGIGGDFNIACPTHTDAAFYKYTDGSEYELEIIDHAQWGRLQLKDTDASIPSYIYIDKNFPLKKVYLYPTPGQSGTLILHNQRKLSSFASLSETVSLPDGYERSIEFNLAIEMAPEYGRAVSADLRDLADKSFTNIKRANIEPEIVGLDTFLVGGRPYDWRVGP